MVKEELLLTYVEAAELLGVKKHKIHNSVYKGKLSKVRGTNYISRADLERFGISTSRGRYRLAECEKRYGCPEQLLQFVAAIGAFNSATGIFVLAGRATPGFAPLCMPGSLFDWILREAVIYGCKAGGHEK